VPALSIIIPATADVPSLETTLVSVLENRPRQCEVVVALAHAYDDPYALAGEVRFIDAGPGATWTECVSAALAQTAGEVVHVLASGARVEPEWVEAAQARFRNARVAAVAPLVVRAGEPAHGALVGVALSRGGQRRLVQVGPNRPAVHAAVGPLNMAAFYRRAALNRLGPLSAAVDAAADVDVAAGLARLGFLAAFEPRSRVTAPAQPAPPPSSFRYGRHLERVFWRHASHRGWLRPLAAHAAVVAGELAASLLQPALLLRVAGRLAGALEAPRWRAFRSHLAAQVEEAAAERYEQATVPVLVRRHATDEHSLRAA
jgi:hypothetical protein